MLPLVKKYGAAVVAISNDETAFRRPNVRFSIAKKIVERARITAFRARMWWSIRW